MTESGQFALRTAATLVAALTALALYDEGTRGRAVTRRYRVGLGAGAVFTTFFIWGAIWL